MKGFFKNHSLSIVALVLFALFMTGQALTGWRHYNDEQQEHGQEQISLSEYLGSGDFWEATAENWESEFLQMGAFLLMSAFLMQRGSSQSKKEEEEDEEPVTSRSPWPVRKGGLARKLYDRSLSITFGLLFLASFAIHAVSGLGMHNREALAHGEQQLSERVHVGCGARAFLHRVARERIARVEAGDGFACSYWGIGRSS